MGDFNFTAVIIFLCVISGVVGWAVIELILWLLSFVSITIG